ncbi:hypothetical protein BCR37DRAFT_385277 [Protomyces lactucae-debilis]|uniref:Pyridoxamine 5'-phosphate oxidase N-terminal domain-containing protein n=1 Tax=Protomyces lactucae-debilis TaxID=2754530 RepID=A0A1Y2FS20_PROLT|nr:uncharacterized protein BCR37DRAFT_385277 [Protomyces lactucae-debilis]ORY86802.1 hypothetical protein BCR37DRAFT_385277 [Protomyces lactucae-debilis]
MSTEANSLPADVVSCLTNARYLHLGTCSDNWPHVSLMNYLYIRAGQGTEHTSKPDEDCVIMTCSRKTKKFFHLSMNPKVSVLVHDWSTRQQVTNSSDLTQLLSSLNAASLSKYSITLNGTAEVLEGEHSEYFKKRILDSSVGSEARCYMDGEDTAVIAVHFGSARISDKENNVNKWKHQDSEMTPGQEHV